MSQAPAQPTSTTRDGTQPLVASGSNHSYGSGNISGGQVVVGPIFGDSRAPIAPRSNHTYDNTNVSGQATAIFGDNHAEIVNVFNDYSIKTLVASPFGADSSLDWEVRQNRVLHDYTIETIGRYGNGGSINNRGLASQVQHQWYRKETIGGGLYAEVHREERADEAGRTVNRAVKVLRRTFLQKLGIDYRKELNALIQFSQPQYRHMFVHFFGWYEHYNDIFISMEYAPLGDLSTHIGTGMIESDAKEIIFQILSGLCVMHRLDFVHRDIKPPNIFVYERPTDNNAALGWLVKIGDFGITKNTLTQNTNLYTNIGTQAYKAPEVIGLVDSEHDSYYDAKCDIWSLGCLLLELLTGSSPFPRPTALRRHCSAPSASLEGVLSRARLEISTWAFSVLDQLLTPAPGNRPTADQALEYVSDWVSAQPGEPRIVQGWREGLKSAPSDRVPNANAASEMGKSDSSDFLHEKYAPNTITSIVSGAKDAAAQSSSGNHFPAETIHVLVQKPSSGTRIDQRSPDSDVIDDYDLPPDHGEYSFDDEVVGRYDVGTAMTPISWPGISTSSDLLTQALNSGHWSPSSPRGLASINKGQEWSDGTPRGGQALEDLPSDAGGTEEFWDSEVSDENKITHKQDILSEGLRIGPEEARSPDFVNQHGWTSKRVESPPKIIITPPPTRILKRARSPPDIIIASPLTRTLKRARSPPEIIITPPPVDFRAQTSSESPSPPLLVRSYGRGRYHNRSM